MKRLSLLLLWAALLFAAGCSVQTDTASVPEPAEFFGFEIGADKKLAHPDEIISYLKAIEAESGRIRVFEVGRTTEDNPFVMAIISSEENIRDLDKYREMNAKLADPRLITDSQADELIRDGKAIVALNAGIHSTEVGAAAGHEPCRL